MAIAARQAVSVSTTPTRLDMGSGDRVLLVSQGTGTLVLGGAGVAAGTGCRVAVVAGTTVAVDVDQNEELWGVTGSGSVAVDVLVGGA